MKNLKEKLSKFYVKYPFFCSGLIFCVIMFLLIWFSVILNRGEAVGPVAAYSYLDDIIINATEANKEMNNDIDVVEDVETIEVEEVIEEVTSNEIIEGQTLIPLSNEVHNIDKNDLEVNEEDYKIYHYDTGEEVTVKLIDGFTCTYSDDYIVSMSTKDDKDYVELYFMSTNINKFCSTEDYIRANLVNQGYLNVMTKNIKDKDWYVCYSSINSNEEDMPQTSIAICTIMTDEYDCTEVDCKHASILLSYCYTYDLKDEAGVLDYAEKVINNITIE